MDQSPETRISLSESDFILETVPYPGSREPKGLDAVPCRFHSWNFCCYLIPEMISRVFDTYKILNTRLVRKLLRHMRLNLQSLASAYEIRQEVVWSSCKIILLHNCGLTALTFVLLLP